MCLSYQKSLATPGTRVTYNCESFFVVHFLFYAVTLYVFSWYGSLSLHAIENKNKKKTISSKQSQENGIEVKFCLHSVTPHPPDTHLKSVCFRI
jgi:hypothetical protein